jgi:23S rRNA (uridine2552-2'-O)-methyltransferase
LSSSAGKGRGSQGGGRGGGRTPKVRLKTASKRTLSSQRWLERQLNDPYVHAAKRAGWRSRAAFKLIELDDRFRLLRPGARVVDLGAAPGGWTQVAVDRVRARDAGGGAVVAIDIQAMDPVPGALVLHADFMAAAAPGLLKRALGESGQGQQQGSQQADVVLSDMAAPATGHGRTDHLRVVALCEAAYAFACEVLAPGGVFLAKVFQGGAEGALLARLKRDFSSVRHAKPPASRAQSSETYVVAQGFRG